MSAYRNATLTPPVDTTPPWWQRLAAKVAPNLSGACDWQWYRRAVGGRWCRVRLTSHTVDLLGRYQWRVEGETWAHLTNCPRTVEIGRRRYSAGLDFATRLPMPMNWDAEAVHTVDTEGRCSCEVWP